MHQRRRVPAPPEQGARPHPHPRHHRAAQRCAPWHPNPNPNLRPNPNPNSNPNPSPNPNPYPNPNPNPNTTRWPLLALLSLDSLCSPALPLHDVEEVGELPHRETVGGGPRARVARVVHERRCSHGHATVGGVALSDHAGGAPSWPCPLRSYYGATRSCACRACASSAVGVGSVGFNEHVMHAVRVGAQLQIIHYFTNGAP